MKKRKLIVATLTIFVVFCTLIIIVKMLDYKKKTEFSHEIWMAEPNKRYMIVEDMINKYDLKGMKKAEIINLLGEPDNKNKVGGRPFRTNKTNIPIDYDSQSSICYFIKTGKMPEEFKGFYLKFNRFEKVIDYAILYFTT